MSRLEELIQQLCPNGVEYKAIKEEYQRLKGTPITATKMKEIAHDGGNIRVFAGGKTVIDTREKDIPNANIIRVPAVLVQSRGVIDCGFVNYIEDSNMKNVMKMNPFIKPAKGFNYQNEFRFCADTDNTNLLELDAHIDFRDIAVPIRLNDFAKTVSFNDGCLKCKPDFTEEP